MKLSEAGLLLIQRHEGLSLRAYKCPAGVWTIGWGHTKGVKPDDLITAEQAREFLKSDVRYSEAIVSLTVHVRLSQSMFDALVSFVFNVGEGNFRKSTLLKLLNQGLYELAAEEFKKWVYSNGKKLNGLINRRLDERTLFLSGMKNGKPS